MKDQILASVEKELIESYINFYNSFQIPEMINLFTDNCIFQNISQASTSAEAHGKKELLKLAVEGAALFQDRKQTVTNWIVSKGKAVVEIDYKATLALDLPNGLKKGSTLNLKGVSIFEFEGNKIKRLADYS